jgi:hypothetical protein
VPDWWFFAFLFCWHFSYRTCAFCKARSDWLQLPLAALHINRHRVTSKMRLTMPRVKMSRANRNPWLAKMTSHIMSDLCSSTCWLTGCLMALDYWTTCNKFYPYINKWANILRLGVCCLTPLSTIFQLFCGRQFYLVKETVVPGGNQRPAASHWLTFSHNVVSVTPRPSVIQTYNFIGDRHWLHR